MKTPVVLSSARVRLSAATIAIAAGMAVFLVQGCADDSAQSGETKTGMTLVYEVDLQGVPEADRDAIVQKVARMMDRRVNPGWSWNSRAKIEITDEQRITVSVFGNDAKQVQLIEDMLKPLGMLEFRIVANRRDHASIINQALKEPQGAKVKDSDGKILAWWVVLKPKGTEYLATDPQLATRPLDAGGREILVMNDQYNVTGADIKSAASDVDERNKPIVNITLNQQGGEHLAGLTGGNLPTTDDAGDRHVRNLGIILDGQLLSAPALQSKIADRAQVTGNFDAKEVKVLAATINLGFMPANIKLVEKR